MYVVTNLSLKMVFDKVMAIGYFHKNLLFLLNCVQQPVLLIRQLADNCIPRRIKYIYDKDM